MNYRHGLAAVSAAMLLAMAQSGSKAGNLSSPYIDPDQFTKVPWGSHSQWAQPWRAYGGTVPASAFLDGTGINFNIHYENPDLIAKMFSSHGMRNARIEIGWNNIDYNDETKLVHGWEPRIRAMIQACKDNHLRPLILLNSNQGGPCPELLFDREVAAAAHAGDTTLQLTDVTGLKVGYSGLNNLTGGWVAEALITKIEGHTITLSKSLTKDIPAGAKAAMATLKYRPFSAPGTEDNNATLAGWGRYVGSVANYVSGILGTSDKPDKGFDMEIWNELTFGSKFLTINNYYATKIQQYNERAISADLVQETADFVDRHAADFTGVQFEDGFANTTPWAAASLEPDRINAIGKHPYTRRYHFPKDAGGGTALNARYEKDSYAPNYTAYFPEYYGSYLQTETMVRDMGPLPSTISRIEHGRNSRVRDGKVIPATVWITEVNMAPGEDDITVPDADALAIKAKIHLRYFCFYLNKGVSRIYLYGAVPNSTKFGDKGLGVATQKFDDLANQKNAVYPSDDTDYTSPTLAVLKRVTDKMKSGVDSSLTKTHAISLLDISDTHDNIQFAGDGTPEHPNLYDRDVFAFLPYQVNKHRWVIPYYVVTRDVMKSFEPEKFTLTLDGFSGKNAAISAYDPIKDKSVPVTVDSSGGQSAKITVTAADYPYLLTIDDPTLK